MYFNIFLKTVVSEWWDNGLFLLYYVHVLNVVQWAEITFAELPQPPKKGEKEKKMIDKR